MGRQPTRCTSHSRRTAVLWDEWAEMSLTHRDVPKLTTWRPCCTLPNRKPRSTGSAARGGSERSPLVGPRFASRAIVRRLATHRLWAHSEAIERPLQGCARYGPRGRCAWRPLGHRVRRHPHHGARRAATTPYSREAAPCDRAPRLGTCCHVVTASPGLYLIGTPFLRRRRSSFIHGAASTRRTSVTIS